MLLRALYECWLLNEFCARRWLPCSWLDWRAPVPCSREWIWLECSWLSSCLCFTLAEKAAFACAFVEIV